MAIITQTKSYSHCNEGVQCELLSFNAFDEERFGALTKVELIYEANNITRYKITADGTSSTDNICVGLGLHPSDVDTINNGCTSCGDTDCTSHSVSETDKYEIFHLNEVVLGDSSFDCDDPVSNGTSLDGFSLHADGGYYSFCVGNGSYSTTQALLSDDDRTYTYLGSNMDPFKPDGAGTLKLRVQKIAAVPLVSGVFWNTDSWGLACQSSHGVSNIYIGYDNQYPSTCYSYTWGDVTLKYYY